MGFGNYLEKHFPRQIKLFKAKHPVLVNLINHDLSSEDKITIYEKLGASRFQNVVFKAEKVKFKVLKTICPNFLKYHDKYIDWQKNKALKKVKSEEARKKIIEKAIWQKKMTHKEFNRELNRNYHMNLKRPTEIVPYLKWNKKVHMKGIKKDVIAIPILIGISLLGFTAAIPLLIIELGSAFINFECINIQNYNLERFQSKAEKLKKIEIKNIIKSEEKYSDAYGLITKKHQEKEDIPTIDEIVSNIKNKEQLLQMRELLQNQIAENRRLKSQIERRKI